jgi:hypothetical protein
MAKPAVDLSVLAKQAGSTRSQPQPRTPPSESPPENRKTTAESSSRGRMLGSHVPPEAKLQFDVLSAEQGKTKEDLHAEAINNLFAKYGKPELCPIKGRSRRKQTA